MQEPCENRFCSLLLFEAREINRFLEIYHRDPRKILRASRNSILEPRYSILDSFEDRGSSFESRLSTYICTVLYVKLIPYQHYKDQCIPDKFFNQTSTSMKRTKLQDCGFFAECNTIAMLRKIMLDCTKSFE